MSRAATDPRRTVAATRIPEYPDCDERPGDCYVGADFAGMLLFGCPGCGRFGGVRAGHPKPEKTPSWDIVAGALDDVTTLSLQPSINCVGCCGWHGYLTDGVFRSC